MEPELVDAPASRASNVMRADNAITVDTKFISASLPPSREGLTVVGIVGPRHDSLRLVAAPSDPDAIVAVEARRPSATKLPMEVCSSLPTLAMTSNEPDGSRRVHLQDQLKANSLSNSKDAKRNPERGSSGKMFKMPKFGIGMRRGMMGDDASYSQSSVQSSQEDDVRRGGKVGVRSEEAVNSSKQRQRAATVPVAHPKTVLSGFFGLRGSHSVFASAESTDLSNDTGIAESSTTSLRTLQGQSRAHPTSPLHQESTGVERGVIKVFRPDLSSTAIHCDIMAFTTDVIRLVARKFFLADASKYCLAMANGNNERVLRPDDQPLILQQKIMQEFGYKKGDNIDAVVIEDISFLCRFILKEIASTDKVESYLKGASKTHIILTGFNLSALPISAFEDPTEIEAIDLTRNPNITELPTSLLYDLKALCWLSMSQNQLLRVPASISLLPTLVNLDLSSNFIADLEGTGLNLLHSLETLNLSKNMIDSFPVEVTLSCQKLKSIDLSNNRLALFPASIASNLGKTLRFLDLSFCRIGGTIPSSIGDLRALAVFRVAFNNLYGGLPNSITELDALVEVDIRGNSFGESVTGEEMPVMSVLARCPSVETIRADGNSIRWAGRWRDKTDLRRGAEVEDGIGMGSTFFMTAPTGVDVSSPVTIAGEGESDDRDNDGPVGAERSLEFGRVRRLTMSYQFTSVESRTLVARLSNMTATLTELNLANCGIEDLPQRIFERLQGLEYLNLTGNLLKRLPPFTFDSKDATRSSLAPSISSKMSGAATRGRVGVLRLRELKCSNNFLESLPAEIGDLTLLTLLDVQRNQIREIPVEIWKCASLKFINASSNLLESFPRPETGKNENKPQPQHPDEGKANSPGATSVMSGVSSKSAAQQKANPPLSHALERLYLADNYLTEDVYVPLNHLPFLVCLNVSLNNIADISPWLLATIPGCAPWYSKLKDLLMSGNAIASLPAEMEKMRSLRWLFLNGNRLSTIPGELAKLNQLRSFDVGGQLGGRGEGSGLRYNVTNWPIDWNWSWNLNLRYLNLSGNTRLEIRPSQRSVSVTAPSSDSSKSGTAKTKELADFSALTKLRLLGLMDVTCLILPPDETVDRRVRTTRSEMTMMGLPNGSIGYGIADALGQLHREDSHAPISPTASQASPQNNTSLLTPLSMTSSTVSTSDLDTENVVGVWDLVQVSSNFFASVFSDSFVFFLHIAQPKFRGRDNEALFGVCDGRGTAQGNRMAKHLYDVYGAIFARELEKVEREYTSHDLHGHIIDASATPHLDPELIKGALRRSFLHANRELGMLFRHGGEEEDVRLSTDKRATSATSATASSTGGSPVSVESSASHATSSAPAQAAYFGCSAVVAFILGPLSDEGASRCSVYVANIGDGIGVLSRDGGRVEVMTRNHVMPVEIVSQKRRMRRPPVDPARSPSIRITPVDDDENAEEEVEGDTVGGDVEVWPETEISRVRCAGGWISPEGLVNGSVDVTRSFGYYPFLGPITSDPYIQSVELELDSLVDIDDAVSANSGGGVHAVEAVAVKFEQVASQSLGFGDEFLVLASSGVWKALSFGGSYTDSARTIIRVARSAAASAKPSNPQTPSYGSKANANAPPPGAKSMGGSGWGSAATAVRDIAMGAAGGSGSGIAVMVLGLRELARKTAWNESGNEKRSVNKLSKSSSKHLIAEEAVRNGGKVVKVNVLKFVQVLYKEIQPPTGRLALVFTDIKNSTALWEKNTTAMKTAIKLHNATMRRLLQNSGGYEVKTEGDAFMVSFQDILKAVEWCLTAQLELRNVDWPKDILECSDGAEIKWQNEASEDPNSTSSVLLFRGLWVRMGLHFGSPLCEVDPVTARMDYYGPMVNRSARVTSVCQGGQILVSYDAMKEVQTRIGYRTSMTPQAMSPALASMSLCWRIIDGDNIMDYTAKTSGDDAFLKIKKMGLHAWFVGEVKLKGLETPEAMYMPLVVPPVTLKPVLPDFFIDKASIESLASLCQRLETLAARSSDEWQEKRLSGGMWAGAGNRNSALISPTGSASLLASSPQRTLSPVLPTRKSFLPSSLWIKAKTVETNVDETDQEGLLALTNEMVTRIENAISILYMTKPSPFSKVLKSLGEAMEDDPGHVLQALQMYAQQLAEKRKPRTS
ncbi:cysteinyl-tRNA synthetase [Irineochytrium annulatum]|nr:cysteinyl-tRNA synthetase [Irineochytrium annulatum]